MTAYGPAADVDDGGRERLVHRDASCRRSGAIPARSPSASANADAEHERDVLDRVVLVDLEVAVGVDREVEQAVVGERAEEVVVEADARSSMRGVAGAVEAERDRDLGLARRAGDASRGGPRAARSSSVAERGGHALRLRLAISVARPRR